MVESVKEYIISPNLITHFYLSETMTSKYRIVS